MIICPECNGDKEVFTFENRGLDYKTHTHGMRPCRTCEGSGEISKDHINRIEKGSLLRKSRLSQNVTLRGEAKRLGITVVELSKLERGEK